MVPFEKLQSLVKKSGLKMEEQAAFYKVAVGSRSIYIAKTQKVSRVDLSGFNIKHSAVTRLTESEAQKAKLGHVRGQIDFTKSEDRVLEAFSTSLAEMKLLAKGEGKEPKKAARIIKRPSAHKPAVHAPSAPATQPQASA